MQKEYKITFLPLDRETRAGEDQNILETAMQAGVHINASCGGNGVCGKCKIRIRSGIVVSETASNFNQTERDSAVKLACQSIARSDAVIEIPFESQIDKSAIRRITGDSHISSDFRATGLFENVPVKSFLQKIYMELPIPTLEDNIADLDRIIRQLGNVFPGHRISASLETVKDLAALVRDSEWKITATVRHSDKNLLIVRVEPGKNTSRIYSIVIDVGTTTVCGRLIDVSEDSPHLEVRGDDDKPGRALSEMADYNGQISYGEDVISRIMYARKKGGLKRLQTVLVKTINNVIHELLTAGGVERDKICQLVFAGNTTMTHLLLGIDPTYIMLEPYTPVVTSFSQIPAKDLGIEVGEYAYASVLPCVTSYIGGDIVGGVLSSGIYKSEKISLFMDIGTNGEIVLGNREWLLSVSCSAGPAFEGGGIRFGMRASRGAIERVRINPFTFEPMIFTVDKTKPVGICGSGLIDVVSELLESGLIDQKGKFRKDAATTRIRKGADGHEYVLCFAPETEIGRDIVVTELDLDNLIRTKAAVYAGCRVLLESAGLAFSDNDKLINAGVFAHYIDIEKAKIIGLLPELPIGRFRFIGNGSLSGAHLVSLNRDIWADVERMAGMMTNIELSRNSSFMEEFVAAMFLPHTHLDLFPETMEKLKGL